MINKLYKIIFILSLCCVSILVNAQEKATQNAHLKEGNFVILLDSTLIPVTTIELMNKNVTDMSKMKFKTDGDKVYKGKELIGFKKDGKYYGNMGGHNEIAYLLKDNKIKIFRQDRYAADHRLVTWVAFYQLGSGPILFLDRANLLKTFSDKPFYLEKVKKTRKYYYQDDEMMAIINEYNADVTQ